MAAWVRVRAVSLEGIRTEVGSRCGDRPSAGSQLARLWQEARKALEITDWTENLGALRFDLVEYTREVDAQSLRVTDMREQARRGYYDRSTYRSLPAERLARDGYVQPVPGGTEQWEHFAPDADVLLSESFLATHCFGIATAG